MANKPMHGTQTWIKECSDTNEERRKNAALRVAAYYGSIEKYRAIPDWKHYDISHPSEKVVLLNHGYDETKPMEEFTMADMEKAASFRGGKCLGEVRGRKKQDAEELRGLELWDTPLELECAEGHRFTATPRLILLGGHWCPQCFPYPYQDVPEDEQRPWHWDAEAKRNPFFAQLWTPLHEDEDNVYDAHVFDGWEK